MPAATPGLYLDYLPLANGGARLVRLYGHTPCPVLPETVDGLPLTELGPYCFAPAQRERLLPPPDALRRYAVPGGPGTDTAGPAFAPVGPAVSANQPGAGRPRPDEGLPPRIAGAFLETLTLPDTLRVVGEAAFYDCRRLRTLCFGRRLEVLGSDAFTNTFALNRLVVRAGPGQATGLARVLACLQGEVQAVFAGEGPGDATESGGTLPVSAPSYREGCESGVSAGPGPNPLAVLWYPEYWEDIEETPAHILLHTFSGRGYQYRQCFAGGAPAFGEYDAVLHQTGEGDAPATMAMLALDRLRWPWALTGSAAADYRGWLAADGRALHCVRRLLKDEDAAGLRALLAQNVLDPEGLEQAGALAVSAENAEAAALFADALRQKRAVSGPRYDFGDF